jgi:hypothetical protein
MDQMVPWDVLIGLIESLPIQAPVARDRQIGDLILDITTMLALRYLLEKPNFGAQTFMTVQSHRKQCGRAMHQQVTLIDPSLFASPSSIINDSVEWYPVVYQIQNGN